MYKAFHQTVVVICTKLPPSPQYVYGRGMVIIPKNMKVKRVTIRVQIGSDPAVNWLSGLIHTEPSDYIGDYLYLQVQFSDQQGNPVIFEVTKPDDFIKNDIYLAIGISNVGEGATFSILFEGED